MERDASAEHDTEVAGFIAKGKLLRGASGQLVGDCWTCGASMQPVYIRRFKGLHSGLPKTQWACVARADCHARMMRLTFKVIDGGRA